MIEQEVKPDERKSREGPALVAKAPPDACVIRPWRLKLHGLAPQAGEIQGNLEHVRIIAGKHRTFWGPLCEWVEVEGERV